MSLYVNVYLVISNNSHFYIARITRNLLFNPGVYQMTHLYIMDCRLISLLGIKLKVECQVSGIRARPSYFILAINPDWNVKQAWLKPSTAMSSVLIRLAECYHLIVRFV